MTTGRQQIVCPYLLVCGKCSLDKRFNNVCNSLDKTRICDYGKEKLAKQNKKSDRE